MHYCYIKNNLESKKSSVHEHVYFCHFMKFMPMKKMITLCFTHVWQEVEYEGVKFPAHLDTPYAVAQVLNQEPGKMRAKDLRDGGSTLLLLKR